jgi:hypothetical protein
MPSCGVFSGFRPGWRALPGRHGYLIYPTRLFGDLRRTDRTWVVYKQRHGEDYTVIDIGALPPMALGKNVALARSESYQTIFFLTFGGHCESASFLDIG